MTRAKAILVEGIPGSGKSSLAQALARGFAASGVPARWWYEEEAGHPVYLFADAAGLQRTVADLAGGRHRAVVAAALAAWGRFAAGVRAGEEVVVADGTLFGYLTWSLFAVGVPGGEIAAYVAAVEALLAGTGAAVIHLRQDDVARSLRRLGAARGDAWLARAVARAAGSAPGRARGLDGFAGLVAYWAAYRDLADRLFARLALPKLAIETGAGDWRDYEGRALALLGLPPVAEDAPAPGALARWAGRYRRAGGAGESCAVTLADGALHLDGLPGAWPQTRLLPRGDDTFATRSLPIAVRFAAGADGARMTVAGAALLGGEAGDGVWVREGGAGATSTIEKGY